MRSINTSTFDFSTPIQNGFVYVDKTRQIYELARRDAVMRTDKGIYIFEFKYSKSAKAAIKQCRERNYATAFADDPR